MDTTTLGRTDIAVSKICLGTMTWGHQNTEAQAHEQLDAAFDAGVNFVDSAEMYPFPSHADTWGASERFLGSWMKARGNRDKVVVATKIVGPADRMAHIRNRGNGGLRLDREQIIEAVDASLARLDTDYIDVYQLHWPARKTNFFGQLGYAHNASDDTTPLEESLSALAEQVAAGKIRTIGISNETPWGLMHLLQLAERLDLPRIVSIQNPYNLLNRSFEVGLAECALREDVGLLAYSPLGFGTLAGKYLNGAKPDGARLVQWPHFARYTKPQGIAATERYIALAHDAGLDPVHMALAYVTSRPFTTTNIIGATTLDQLNQNLGSLEVSLSDDVISEIDAIHTDIPNPAP